MTDLTPGPSTIPGFRLAASTGQTLSWESFAGKMPITLVFLPSLDSVPDSGLISEISSQLVEFGRQRSQVLVVAKVTARHAREIAAARSWNVPILADASGAMMRDFEINDADGTRRRVAIIAGKDGEVIHRVDPIVVDDDHASSNLFVSELLDMVRSLG